MHGQPPNKLGIERCLQCAARSISVCAVDPYIDTARLASLARSAMVAPGETFVEAGTPVRDFITVVTGCAAVTRLLPDGRRQIVEFLFPGDFFGTPFEDTHSWSAEALDEIAVCRFPRAAFMDLVSKMPELGANLFARAASDLAEARDQQVLLGRKTARERISAFLLAVADRLGSPNDAVDLPMSRSDIADYLGLTIETVSRGLTALQRDGLIRLEGRRRVQLVDRAALVEIAEGL